MHTRGYQVQLGAVPTVTPGAEAQVVMLTAPWVETIAAALTGRDDVE